MGEESAARKLIEKKNEGRGRGERKKSSRNRIKREVKKESRTDIESATFEAPMKVVAIAILIYMDPKDKRKVIFIHNHEKSTSQNQVLEMFISMKIDAECNETSPAILFDRFHEDLNIKKDIKCCPRDNINRRV